MAGSIRILAGSKALALIRDGGFDASNITGYAAASGGPKFLVLNGIDRALFSSWFKNRKDPLLFTCSSIGAWRGVALAQKNPLEALDALEDAYMLQHYSAKPSPAEVSQEARRLLDAYLDSDAIDYILKKSNIRLNIFASRPTMVGGSRNIMLQSLHMSCALLANILHRRLLTLFFKRSVFSSTDTVAEYLAGLSEFDTKIEALTESNIKDVVMASGAIPLVMDSVFVNTALGRQCFQDGGILDYHFDLPFCSNPGLTLYPHYSHQMRPGWFDKHLPWRRADQEKIDNVIMIAPSKEFVEKLPNARIPSRRDFAFYKGEDRVRVRDWRRVTKLSQKMGEEMIELFESGKVRSMVEPLR